jgi:predicted nucleotidyltransferase
MRKILLDISRKIDSKTLEVLKTIKYLADTLQVDFFLIGATVRDMILNYAYDIKVYRATNDIDFAVRVKSWEEYYKLTAEVEKAGFRKDERIAHRFYTDALIIDFIPFGEITDKNHNITWKDIDKKEMTVIGFEDAFANTVEILIEKEPDVMVPAASVESLVMLKIFAWNGRAAKMRLKDARDLYLIISTYLRAGNEERLFEDHTDIVTAAVDYELTGARLLGRDIARVASDEVKSTLLKILSEDKLSLLANEMAQYEGLSFERDEKVEKSLELLNNLHTGLREES